MRMIVCAIAALTLIAPPAVLAAPDPAADVRAAFMRYDEGWRTANVEAVVGAFSDDFDWVNSVGLRFSDKGKLTRFLTHLFADPDYRAGQPAPTEVRSVRMADPDVAVVLSRQRTDGKINSATGKAIPTLYTDEITVLRRTGGRWLIISDLSSDEANGV